MLGGEAIGRAAFDRVGPGLEIQPHRVDVVITARFARAVGPAMHEARWDAFVDIAAFLHLDPALVANKREAPIKRRRRQAGDAAARAIGEIDLGADEILRWRGEYRRSRARGDARRFARQRYEQIAEMDAKRGPGAGWRML